MPYGLCAFTAAAGGLVTTHAEIVQINVNHFYATTTAPNVLNKDLTGDGVEDIPLWQLYTIDTKVFGAVIYSTTKGLAIVGTNASTQQAFASFRYYYNSSNSVVKQDFWVGVRNKDQIGSDETKASNPATRHGLIQVRFTDSRINGGTETKGYLHVRAMNFTHTQHHIDFIRLIYDDASTEYPTEAEWTNVYRIAEFPDPPIQDSGVENRQRAELEADLAALTKQLRKTKKALRKAVGPSTRLKKKLKKLKKRIRQKKAQIAAASV